ncbi:hypothetical protein BS47DRAFT_54187 [Hydnum rufescens UP504]|uniref:DUF6534 domain-containing protein n=1 Tax=Hydnum rufescens UP504 TaxID=1448309 RepID=A0A9P6ARM1_9AGAM|nr:hypothetical protein BS47DRAFT_54187 [Hydnum rufescens UP504]
MGIAQGEILAGTFFGNLLTALGFGILTIQTSSYYRAFSKDGRPVKLAVAFLWISGAVQLACCTRSVYWWFVMNFRNGLALERAPWEFGTYPINVTFFVYRVYSLSGNLYVGMLVQVLVLLQFGFGGANGIKAILEFQGVVNECTWIIVAWLAIQAIADVVIATYMCLLLRHRRTGYHKTDSVINRLVLYVISTGLVTSILSCICLVLFAKYGFNIGVLVTGMPLGVFYSISMLTNLHMRTRLRARLHTPSPLELTAYSITKRVGGNARDRGNEERFQPTRINITREVVCDDMDINLMNRDTKL